MSPVEVRPDPEPRPDANESLEIIFDTADETEALVVEGLLESNGVECLEIPREAEDVMPGVGSIALRVRSEQAAQARSLIEEYRRDDSEDLDVEIEGETSEPQPCRSRPR